MAVERSVDRFIPSLFGWRMLQWSLIAEIDWPSGFLRNFHTITAPLSIQSAACPITIANPKAVIRIIRTFAIRDPNMQSLTRAQHWKTFFKNRFRFVPGFVVARSHQIIPWSNRFRMFTLSE
jgi:hypothetical protein